MKSRVKTAALGSLAILLACGVATASEPGKGNAMRVAIDKETGKLRAATAQEVAELRRLEAQQPSQSRAATQTPVDEAEAVAGMRVFESGFIGMDLPLSLYSSLEATVGHDGDMIIRHAHPEHDDADRSDAKEAGHDTH
jgi:hypothetical protein